MSSSDSFSRFIFEEHDIRGEIVQLSSSYLDIINKKDYPEGVKKLLGESIAASVLLSGTLKFDGILSIQARSEGPVSLLLAECSHYKKVRAIAQWKEGEYADCFQTQLSNGQLAITIDPEKGQRYQGIVPMESNSLGSCLEKYFMQSEQLETFILLFADEENAAGIMLQKLPQGVAKDEDAWNRLCHLAQSLSFDELKSLNTEDIIHRLFNEESVRLYPSDEVAFECSCSRERSAKAIQALGKEDAVKLIEERTKIAIDCQFCNEHYEFVSSDIDDLFNKKDVH